MEYIKIEYSNSCDAFDILYHKKFKNIIWVDADVGTPEYVVDEEGAENADGEYIPTFQKWKKVFKIKDWYVQQYMVDALKLMEIHDTIFVTLKNEETSKVSDVTVTEEWDDTIQCFANVTIEFTVDYYTRTNCCENQAECIAQRYLYESAEDYDDGGAGQAIWEAPASYQQKIYFFYDDLTNGIYTGDSVGIYQSIGGEWVLQDMEDYDYAGDTADDVDIVKLGNTFPRVPYLLSVTDLGGGDGSFKGYAFADTPTFVQIQYYSVGGWIDLGDPFYDYQFLAGHTLSPGSGTFDFRAVWYTHSCIMGYSNTVNAVIA